MNHCAALRAFLVVSLIATSSHAYAVCRSIQWVTQGEHATELYFTDTIRLVDTNNDDIQDLLTLEHASNPLNSTLYLRRGVGDGTFEAPVKIAEHLRDTLDAADVDGDGYVDVAVASWFNIPKIIRGTPTGFEAPEPDPSSPGSTNKVALGNFDGDPAVELIGVGWYSFAVYDYVGGSLVPGQQFGKYGQTWSIGVADLDGDGQKDLLVGPSSLSYGISISYGKPDGTFQAPVLIPSYSDVEAFAFGDIDKDGRLDFAVAEGNWGTAGVYLNRGRTDFPYTNFNVRAPGAAEWGHQAFGVALQDLDADDDLDLIVSTASRGGGLVTMAGNGDGTFFTPTWQPSVSGVSSIAIGDLNGDETPDLIAGAFSQQILMTPSCPSPVQVFGHAKPRMITVNDATTIEIGIGGMSPGTPANDRGTVTIGDETVPVDAEGRAAIEISGLPLGEHQIDIDYSGNSELPAASGVATVVVVEEPTEVVITAPSTPPAYGFAYSIRVAVNATDGVPRDPYYVSVDGGPETQYDRFQGDITFYSLTAGPHTIRARYAGDDYSPPGEAVLEITTPKAVPGLSKVGTIRTTVRDGTAPQTDIFLSRPSGSSGDVPTGTLRIEGPSLLIERSVSSYMSITWPVMPRGTHDVVVTYSGDANYESATMNLTVQVLPNLPIAIEARALPGGMHIGYVLPNGATSPVLSRRVAGTPTFQPVAGWNPSTGIDPDVLQRGVVYEYILHAQQSGTIASNVDSAMLFTDDPLAAGTFIKRAHFTELRQAVNQFRAMAGLAPFAFDSDFDTHGALVRASHLNGLRTALAQARSTLGMASVTFGPVSAGATIRASDVLQLRDLAR